MNRKEFIKTCGYSCFIPVGIALFTESCNITKMYTGSIQGSNLIVPLLDFEQEKKGVKSFKKFIIVQNDLLQFPICVYRLDENNYSALLMKCPHQGAELQAFGTKLQCPAHGSEFDHFGVVQSAPADSNLRTFQVLVENNQIKISLK